MARLKFLVGLVGLLSLIFAEGVNPDSAQLNVLKPQRLFYTTAANWIPPTLPDDPTCLWAGCCLIPFTGCIMAGQHIGTKKDSVIMIQDSTKMKRKKWGIGIGYSGGVCWTGEELAKPFEASPIAGLAQLPEYLEAHLYWLNVVEGAISYKLNSEFTIGCGVGYMWAVLENRISHISGAWENEKWIISGLPIQVNLIKDLEKNLYFESTIYSILVSAVDKERHFVFNDSTGGWYYDREIEVSVKGFAVGLGSCIKKKFQLSQLITFCYAAGFNLIIGRENVNNLPIDLVERWKGKTEFNFSGMKISMGLELSKP